MPIYRASFPGVEGTILVRADSAAQAKDQVVAMKALTSDELADALDAGEKVYKPGEPIIPPTDEQKLQALADANARSAGGEAGADDLIEVVTRTHLPSGMHQSLIAGGNPDNDDDWQDEREATPEEIAAATPGKKKA